jgi:alpha-tubulin suppressor-like RCC1 family protein
MVAKNLVLIDSRLPDISGLTNSLTVSTDYIVFNYYTKTLASLYTDISNLATSKSATYVNIALAQDLMYERALSIVNLSDTEAVIIDMNNPEAIITDTTSFSGFKTFLTDLHTNIGTNSFNFLTCNLYNIPNVSAILSSLSTQTNVTIRASNDLTGSTTLKIGNYRMESDGTDISGTFFTSNIDNYTHLFIMDWFNNNQYVDASKNIVGTQFAFATKDISGRVWAWGDTNNGGAGPDSKTAATPVNLSGVIINELYSTIAAFAARDSSGNMWVWGNSTYGGSSVAKTAEKLNITAPITTIIGNSLSFAALDTSGKVWNWSFGTLTTSSNNTNGMSGETIIKLYSCSRGFAALSSTGNVWTWGDIDGSSGISNVTTAYIPINLPSTIVKVYASNYAFAALTSSNKIWAWGNTQYGGLGGATNTAGQISNPALNIKEVYAGGFAFAAITLSGEILQATVWGEQFEGGALSSTNSPLPPLPLTNITSIASNNGAFTAIDISGRLASWGNPIAGSGTGTAFRAVIPYNMPSGMQKLYGYFNSFAAIDASSYVRSWGSPLVGGTNGASPIDISRTVIDAVYSNTQSFAVIDTSARVWAWGDVASGGAGPSALRAATPSGLPTGIVKIYSTRYAYAAIDSTGHIWTWGNTTYGGTGVDAKTAAIPANMADVIIPVPPTPEPPTPPTPEPPQTIVDILNGLSQKNRPASEEDNRIVGRILSGERNFTSYSDYNYRMIAANIGASCNC